MCCHAALEDALIFVEIANSSSEMSPAFNLFLSGQYGTLTAVRPRLLNRDLAYPQLPWQQAACDWIGPGLVGNMEVRNFNINNIWWALRQWLWNWTGIRGSLGGYRACCTLSHCAHCHLIVSLKKPTSINFPTSVQSHGGRRRVYVQARISAVILWALLKVIKNKVPCYICQHLHAIIVFTLSVSRQMFLFPQCLQEWPRNPPLPLAIQHNQIYSGSSAPIVASICLKQTLRALVCHWQLGTNIIQSSSISGCLSPVFVIDGECRMNFHILFIQLKLNNDIEVFFPLIPLLTSIVL